MLSILDPLRELAIISILVRFLLSVLCGGLIGVERGCKRHAAGLRTHAVVCVAASSVMVVNILLCFSNLPVIQPKWVHRSSAALAFMKAPSSWPFSY